MDSVEQIDAVSPAENSKDSQAQKKPTLLGSWRRKLLITVILIVVYTIWQLWSIHQFGHHDDGSTAQCGIVLGAAAYHDKPSPVFKARIDQAISLYQQHRISSIILTGGFGEGADFAESEVAKKYCISQGVPEHVIHTENKSLTTKNNLSEAKKIMTKRKLSSALIISDPWHLKRACLIANHYRISAKPSATQQSLFTTKSSKLKFLVKEFLQIHLLRWN